jgi:glycine reductase
MVKLSLKLIDVLNSEIRKKKDTLLAVRRNYFHSTRGTKTCCRYVDSKINDQPFTTEYPMPTFDRVAPNAQILDMSKRQSPLVTSVVLYPKATQIILNFICFQIGKYDIDGMTI